MKNKLIISSIIALSLFTNTTAYAATYQVNHNKLGSWKLTCNVLADHDKITNVKKVSIKPTLGSITNKSVNLSKGIAYINFTRHIQAFSYHNTIKISVSGSKVYVND